MQIQTFGLPEKEFAEYAPAMAHALHWMNTGESLSGHAPAEAIANLLLQREAAEVIPGFTFSACRCHASWARKMTYSLVSAANVLRSLRAVTSRVESASYHKIRVEVTDDMKSEYPANAFVINLPGKRVVFLPNQS